MAELSEVGVRASRQVEHPCWNFQPTICFRPFPGAAKHDVVSLVDGRMNVNWATKPMMTRIKNLARNDPVGVLKRCCPTNADRIRGLDDMRPDQG
jgi:hypothetical protein